MKLTLGTIGTVSFAMWAAAMVFGSEFLIHGLLLIAVILGLVVLFQGPQPG